MCLGIYINEYAIQNKRNIKNLSFFGPGSFHQVVPGTRGSIAFETTGSIVVLTKKNQSWTPYEIITHALDHDIRITQAEKYLHKIP